MKTKVFSTLVMLVMLASLLFQVTPASAAAPTSAGTDFWLGFPQNYDNMGTMTLFITSEANASGTVSVPGISFSQVFNVSAGGLVSVALPNTAMVTTLDSVTNQGIHITSDVPVTVYGLNQVPYTTDAHLGIPTTSLGADYLVLTYTGTNNGSELMVVGTVNGTTVTITPSVTVGAHTAGTPYTVSLNQGDTYMLRSASGTDLTGSVVTADQPIGVYGGAYCTNIPSNLYSACDHIEEMLPATNTWGQNFLTVPLAGRTGGDAFRVLASQDGTSVSVNGSVVATLNRGQYYQANLTAMSQITASAPVLVAQYANSQSFDGTTGDPFMMLIPPYEQFLGAYTISTPASGFASHYVNVVVPNAVVGTLTLDSVAVPAGSFTVIGSTGYSGAQLTISAGTHRLESALPFGVFVYGWTQYDSYGYPGGQAYAAVATIASLDLTSDASVMAGNTAHATALVKDSNGDPVVGLRVDFAVTGSNSASGFGFTDASGNASYSYVPSNPGNDLITATVGALVDTSPVIVTAANSAPVADNDAYNTPMGTLLNGATVLTGDTDADNDPLTAIKVTDPAHAASFTFNSDGTFAYTPANGFSGDDTFTYKANDGAADSNVATVTITVGNSAPTALTLSNRFIQEERPGDSLIGTLAGTDPNIGDTLTYSLVNTVSCDGTDNGYFAVAGSHLEASATPIDYQTKYFLSICVRATDLGGLTFDQNFTIVVRSLHHFPMDMNGDGTDDYVVFRPSTGTWHLRNSPPIVAFGQNGDLPVGADYNGDGKSDIAVFRPAATGAWHIRGQATPINFGTAGDVPLPLDFNGDKKADLAVFRPSTSTWHIRGQLLTLAFGQSGDIPVPADYNGDGKADIAVFRPSTGSWIVQGQSSVSFGQLGDIPVPFDYNNDGKADFAVYRPSTGTWYVRNVGNVTHGGFYDMPFPMFINGAVRYMMIHAGNLAMEWNGFGFPTITFGANDDAQQ